MCIRDREEEEEQEADGGAQALPARLARGIPALEDAIRAAVRNVLRDQITKPREIRGQVLLWTPPTTVADAGRFHTTATIKLIVDRVVPYRVF